MNDERESNKYNNSIDAITYEITFVLQRIILKQMPSALKNENKKINIVFKYLYIYIYINDVQST
jgi:hypothetical protein